MNTFLSDVRFALRRLSRDRAFTIAGGRMGHTSGPVAASSRTWVHRTLRKAEIAIATTRIVPAPSAAQIIENPKKQPPAPNGRIVTLVLHAQDVG